MNLVNLFYKEIYCTYFKNWNHFSGRSARSLLDVGEQGETRQKWKPILERGVVYMSEKPSKHETDAESKEEKLDARLELEQKAIADAFYADFVNRQAIKKALALRPESSSIKEGQDAGQEYVLPNGITAEGDDRALHPVPDPEVRSLETYELMDGLADGEPSETLGVVKERGFRRGRSEEEVVIRFFDSINIRKDNLFPELEKPSARKVGFDDQVKVTFYDFKGPEKVYGSTVSRLRDKEKEPTRPSLSQFINFQGREPMVLLEGGWGELSKKPFKKELDSIIKKMAVLVAEGKRPASKKPPIKTILKTGGRGGGAGGPGGR
jgi:hypothetical protein